MSGGIAVGEALLSVRLVWPFLRLMRDHGIQLDTPSIGAESDLWDPDTRIPHDAAIDLLEVTRQGLNDDSIGIKAAQRLEPGDLDVLEFAVMSSSTVGEAIESANRYLRLMHDGAEFGLDQQPDTLVWHFRMRPGLRLPPIAAEFFSGLVISAGRTLLRDDLVPRAVHFAHAAPEDTTEHERLFQCPLEFEMSSNAMLVPIDHLSLPSPRANPALKALLDRTAKQLLDRLPRTDTTSDRVRQLVTNELQGGNPNLDNVAEKLGVSPRTLRRRLQEEGTTHKQLVDDVRRDLAMQYLGERSLAVSEVSYLLGFSEPSAFHKAFKRWTGRSPAEHRRNR